MPRALTASVFEDDRRTVGRRIRIAPVHQCVDYRKQVPPLIRQVILAPVVRRGYGRFLDDPHQHHFLKPVAKDVLRNDQCVFELQETGGFLQELSDDQQRPPFTNDLKRARNGAILFDVVVLEHRWTD